MIDPAGILQFAVLGKIFILVLLVFYFILSLVVQRQIELMTQTLNSNVSPVIKIIALLQTVLIALLFVIALLIA